MRGAVLNLACVVELPSTRSNSGAARIRRRPTRLLLYPAKNLLIGASVRNLVELLRPLSAGEKAAILAQAVHEGITMPVWVDQNAHLRSSANRVPDERTRFITAGGRKTPRHHPYDPLFVRGDDASRCLPDPQPTSTMPALWGAARKA